MCLALPARIEKIKENIAVVDYDGVKREVNIDMIDAKEGDYVLIHAGFAIEKVDEESALQNIEQVKRLFEIQDRDYPVQ
jgi:hydrogenase expression/formation protein HypC